MDQSVRWVLMLVNFILFQFLFTFGCPRNTVILTENFHPVVGNLINNLNLVFMKESYSIHAKDIFNFWYYV